jgi:hypothetical protein
MGMPGWLARWRNQEHNESQLDLFGGSQTLVPHQRVDGAIVNRDLQTEISNRGGTQQTHAKVNAIVTQNTLGCTVKELYDETGSKTGNRAALPAEAQKALIVGDIASQSQMEKDDAQGDRQICQSADVGSKAARKLFPW